MDMILDKCINIYCWFTLELPQAITMCTCNIISVHSINECFSS